MHHQRILQQGRVKWGFAALLGITMATLVGLAQWQPTRAQQPINPAAVKNATTIPCGLPANTATVDAMLRDTAAEWLGKCVHGLTHEPPSYTDIYSDVEDGDYNAKWIEQIFNDQITEGCNADNTRYCTKDPVDKAQAVKLILRAEHGGTYSPPLAGTTPYADVADHPDINWIAQAKVEGITTGCGDGANFCPDTVLTQNGFLMMLLGASFSEPIPPPAISFQSDAGQLFEGQSATLSWSVTGASTITIDQGIGAVDPTGSLTVSPDVTTKYTLSATGAGGSSSATVAINLLAPEAEALVLYINAPSAGHSVAEGTVIVSGIVNQPTALVWVNGIAATVTGQTFSATIPLVPGVNQITATASDDGVTVSDSSWVIRDYTYTPQPEGSFGEQYEDLVPDDAALPSYDKERFAVITGQVEDEHAAPIQNAAITIKNHPEYGTAHTDSTGRFSLPVEGGTTHTVIYQHASYLTAHRKIETPTKDIAIVELVRLVVQDSKATTLSFDGNPDTVVKHVSTLTTDDSGSRAMTMVFQGDNRAWEVDKQGQKIRELTSITTRATEFATPQAMPAVLPPNSAFTYCAELGVDGVERIEFDKPVATWVDNFLGFEVGEIVPVGYYDRDAGVWVPSNNGVVVELLDENSDGVVDALDATGDGNPDDLNEDGHFDDEVTGLDDPARYPPGNTFWRVEVRHFTPWDHNWAPGLPEDATPPDPENPPKEDQQEDDPEKDPCDDDVASSIEPRSRIFHEDILVPGTDLSLHYTSNRVPGYLTVFDIPVSGATVPANLLRIEVKIQIAGREMTQTLDAAPNQHVSFAWDGLDYLGQKVTHATTMAHISVGFAYKVVYQAANPDFGQAFAQPGLTATGVEGREEIIVWKNWSLPTAAPQTDIAAGWDLSTHHSVLPTELTTLYKGDGTTLKNSAAIIDTFSGGGGNYCWDDLVGTPASEAYYINADGIAHDSKGNTYLSSTGCNMAFKIGPDGIFSAVIGRYAPCDGNLGDGGPADEAGLCWASGLAVDNEDNLLIADTDYHRIRRVDANGIITTVMGNGWNGWDGEPCINNCTVEDNTMGRIYDIDVDRDGNIYVANLVGSIGKITPDGIYTTIAGCPNAVCPYDGLEGDGFPATSVYLYPKGIAYAPDGSLYFTDYSEEFVGKVDPSGIFTVVAGTGEDGDIGDGGPATEATLDDPQGITLDPEGNIYVSDVRNYRIRKIDTSGIITTVAGTGLDGFSGDGGPATYANISNDWWYSDITFSENMLYFSDAENDRFRMVRLPSPTFTRGTEPGDITFAEENGLGHILSSAGRHKQTVDLHTGVVLRTFAYDSSDRLTSITDQFGNETTIQYDGNGAPVSITSPEGLVTGLTVDADNHLTKITYPDASHYDFTYSSGGLLTTKTEPAGNLFTHTFDAIGRLETASDQEGGQWSYTRTTDSSGVVTARMTTAQSNVTTYADRNFSSGGSESTITYPSGNASGSVFSDDGLTQTLTPSCGMQQEVQYNTDSRYQTLYLQQLQNATPGGLSRSMTTNRIYEDSDSDDIPDKITSTVSLNGKQSVSLLNTLTQTHTTTSPEGRVETRNYDPDSLLTTGFSVPGIADLQYAYDGKGQLTSITQQDRVVSMGYDEHGFLSSIEEPDSRLTTYTHDPIGRITSKTSQSGNRTSLSYDGNGNLSAIITPNGVTHSFTYNDVNKVSNYLVPGGDSYGYSYDKERRLTTMTFPSGGQKVNSYLKTRLSSSQTPDATIAFTYLPGDKVNTVSRGSESIAFTYDGKLLLSTASSGALNQTVSLGYNNDFLVTSLSYAGGTQNFSYDNDGLLTAAAADISRNAANGLPEQLSDGVLTQNRTFNVYGEISAESNTVNSHAVASWSVSRDDNGHITDKSESMNGATHNFVYTYDELDRLLTVTRDASLVETYQYDANGNRTSSNGTASTYDNQDRLTAAGSTTYSYTKDGFLLSKTSGDNTTNYNYTLRGELISVTLPSSDGRTIQYTYDPLGRRITKSDGAVVRKYLWLGRTKLLAVYDGGNNLLMRFHYADHRMPISMTDQAGDLYYLFYDYTGSLRLVTSDAGGVVKQIDYDAFGNVIGDTNSSLVMPFGFAGGLRDHDTGLLHFGARDYDPAVGRWTAKDMLFFTGGETNLYAYVSNDPIRYIDSKGTKKQNALEQVLSIKDDVSGTGFIEKVLEKGSGYLYETADALAKANRDMRDNIDHCYERNEKRYQEALAKNKELRRKGEKYSELFKQGYEFAKNAPEWAADAGGKAVSSAKDTVKSYLKDGFKSLISLF